MFRPILGFAISSLINNTKGSNNLAAPVGTKDFFITRH
jgi:hypothetical protein